MEDSILIDISSIFPTDGVAFIMTHNATSHRMFGDFPEKVIRCDQLAKRAIDDVCYSGGFTQAWESDTQGSIEWFTMTKVPVIILVMLMLGLRKDQEEQAVSLVGAYPICMRPNMRTCMNVIVGRHLDQITGNFVLDKFPLYYPDNKVAKQTPEIIKGNTWALAQGYSWRTAALGTGYPNRSLLNKLYRAFSTHDEGFITQDPPLAILARKAYDLGLIIDEGSAYEDAAYVSYIEGETSDNRIMRIQKTVDAMKVWHDSSPCLMKSYDPAEGDMTVIESEWNLLKRLF